MKRASAVWSILAVLALSAAAASADMKSPVADKDRNIEIVGGAALVVIVVGTLVWVIVGVMRGLRRHPELPAPSQAYPFVPFERYSFETTIAPADVTRTLFLLDDLRRPTYPSREIADHGRGAFHARMTENGFTVRRSSPKNQWDSALNNPYLPVAAAVIRPGARGSVVEVTLRPLWFYAVPLVLIAGTALVDIVQSPRSWPMLAVVGLALALLYLMGWQPERVKLLSFLRDGLRQPASEGDALRRA